MPARVPVAPWRLGFLSCIRAEDAAVRRSCQSSQTEVCMRMWRCSASSPPVQSSRSWGSRQGTARNAVLLAIELAKTLAAARKLSSYVHKLHKITSVTKVPMHAGMCEQAGCRRGTGTGD